MDALRLIKTARHALAEARTVPDVLQEARQAGLLTEAVGARIAEQEQGGIGALGRLLCDAGSHAAGCLDHPPDDPDAAGGPEGDGGPGAEWTCGGRAERLGELGELEPVLQELGSLLHEVAETLVVLACGAEAESVYWRCIDGVDAGAECKDVAAELLRAVRRENGSLPPGADPADFPDPVDVPDAVDDFAEEDLPDTDTDTGTGAGPDGAVGVLPRSRRAPGGGAGGPVLAVRLEPPVAAAVGQS